MAWTPVADSCGVGGTYATIAAAAAAYAVLNLQTLGQRRWLKLKNQTFTEGVVTFSGTTTTATYMITIMPEEGAEHKFKRQGALVNTRLIISTAQTKVRNLRISKAGAGEFGIRANATRVVFDGLFIYDCGDRGIDVTGSATTSSVRNCMCVHNGTTGIATAVASCTVTNNTCVNNLDSGFAFSVAGGAARNLIATGNIVADFSSASNPTTKNYWISSDLTASAATNNKQGVSGVDLFVDATAGSEDCHLKSGSPAIGYALNLATTLSMWWDGEGDPRPLASMGSWDCGADQVVTDKQFAGRSEDTNYQFVDELLTDQLIGSSQNPGQRLKRLILIPKTVEMGEVYLRDGDDEQIPLYEGVGAGYFTNDEFRPTEVDLGWVSKRGAWYVSTDANVSVLAVGGF